MTVSRLSLLVLGWDRVFRFRRLHLVDLCGMIDTSCRIGDYKEGIYVQTELVNLRCLLQFRSRYQGK